MLILTMSKTGTQQNRNYIKMEIPELKSTVLKNSGET